MKAKVLVVSLAFTAISCAVAQNEPKAMESPRVNASETDTCKRAAKLEVCEVQRANETQLRISWAGWPSDSMVVVSFDDTFHLNRILTLDLIQPLHGAVLVRSAATDGADVISFDPAAFVRIRGTAPLIAVYVIRGITVKMEEAVAGGTGHQRSRTVGEVPLAAKNCSVEFRSVSPKISRELFPKARVLPLEIPTGAYVVPVIHLGSVRGCVRLPLDRN